MTSYVLSGCCDPCSGLGGLGALGSAKNCGPWPAKIPFNKNDLHPAMRPVFDRLMQRLNETGLSAHFYPSHGKRTLGFQCRAICEGGSELTDPSRGAHTAALAVDFHAKGPLFRDKWDPGVDTKTHTIIERPAALAMWKAFGNLIRTEFPELTWGGDWKGRYRRLGYTNDQIHVGFDPYHVELKNYRSYLPDSGYWKCEGGKAVKRTDTAAAAAERALEEQKKTLLGVGLMAAAGYFLWKKKSKAR